MASAKLATLIIRTLAKPISNRIKEQVRQHETFRTLCVDLAQFMYRSEVKLRTNILGEPARHVRPLSEAKAIENGANALAEGFLFSVAAALIIGETWRSSRNQSKRRDSVDDSLEDLGTRITELNTRLESLQARWEDELGVEKARNDELTKILERVVIIGLRGGWAELPPKTSNDTNTDTDADNNTDTTTDKSHIELKVRVKDSSLAAVARAVEEVEAASANGSGSPSGSRIQKSENSISTPPLSSTSTSTSTSPTSPSPSPSPSPSTSTPTPTLSKK